MPALDEEPKEDPVVKLNRVIKEAKPLSRKERIRHYEKPKKRSIWKNLGLALAATPMVGIALFVIGIIVGRLAEAVTELESTAGTWALLILVASVAYVASLIYLLYQSSVKRNREGKRLADEGKRKVDTLILYWQEQLAKKSEPQPSSEIIEVVRDQIRKRLLTWAKSDPELWTRHFPEEKYSEHFFGIVDNFMNYWEGKSIEELSEYFFKFGRYAPRNKAPFQEGEYRQGEE